MNARRIGLCGLLLVAAAGALLGWPQSPAAAGTAIVLPHKLVAGHPATLAVLTPDGRLAAGAVVEFSGSERVITDATGRATFIAPPQHGVLLARLPDTVGSGSDVSASATVIELPANRPEGVQVDEFPHVISLHDRFTLSGSGFRGEAEANRAFLGNQPALVLAASPVGLVIAASPHAAPGSTQLLIEVDGRSPGPVPITLVAFELASEKKQLAPKEKSKLVVRVRGSEQPLELEARNLTPEVAKLAGGNVQRLTTRGGRDNTAMILIEGRRPGNFSLGFRLIPAAAGLPDTQAARQHLLAARRLAPEGWGARVDRLLQRMERNPQDALKVRNDLEKLLAENPPGEFGRLLEAAWRILLGR